MDKELVEKLALIYVQANAKDGVSAKDIYQMYKAAKAEIESIESENFCDHVKDGTWHL